MSEFSIGDAAVAGMRLLGRQTFAACVWAALAAGSFTLVCVVFGGPIISLFAMIAQRGGKPDPGEILGMIGSIGGFYLLLIITAVVLKAVIACTIYRAEIYPGRSGFFFLRCGASEGWLMLVSIVRGILVFVLQMVLSIPVSIISLLVGTTTVLAAGHGQAAPGWIGAYLMLSGVLRLIVSGVVIWVSFRLSMAGPMTFVDRRFRLFESWTLTRGLGLPLFTVALLLVLFGLAVLIVLGLLGFGGGVALWGQFPHPATFQGFLSEPPADMLRFLAPFLEWAVVLLFVGDIVMLPVSVAPWAHIYRRLSPETDVAGVFG